ncbi:MAG: putative endonuclease [Patiriisocius sp.]|jgi:putative endonuclease
MKVRVLIYINSGIFYFLFSDRLYTCETNHITLRIKKHNEHTYKGSFTKIASDWKFKLVFERKKQKIAPYLELFATRIKFSRI